MRTNLSGWNLVSPGFTEAESPAAANPEAHRHIMQTHTHSYIRISPDTNTDILPAGI